MQSAREAAISYAAYRLLLWRYAQAAGLQKTFDELTSTMESLCYRPGYTSTRDDSPAALGTRIAAAVITFGKTDGSLEQQPAVDVIRLSSALDPSDDQRVDIGLDALGNNRLGTNDGHGYTVNPVTGKPYAPELGPLGDYGRIVAEFWADGPASETPPGHWNVI